MTTTDPAGGHASIQAGVDFSNSGGTVSATTELPVMRPSAATVKTGILEEEP